MASNRNRRNGSNENNNGAGNGRRRIRFFLFGLVAVGVIFASVFAYPYYKNFLPGKSHHSAAVTPPPKNVIAVEDNGAPTCATVGTDIFGKSIKLTNADDQPILNDNSQHLAPQYTCIYEKDDKTYTVGTSKEKPLPKKKSTGKTQPDPLFDYIVGEYTTGSELSAHAYTAVAGYNDKITASTLKVIKTAKVFIYDDNQVRGGAFKCGNVILSVSVDSNVSIGTMNDMVAAALKNSVLQKECSK